MEPSQMTCDELEIEKKRLIGLINLLGQNSPEVEARLEAVSMEINHRCPMSD